MIKEEQHEIWSSPIMRTLERHIKLKNFVMVSIQRDSKTLTYPELLQLTTPVTLKVISETEPRNSDGTNQWFTITITNTGDYK